MSTPHIIEGVLSPTESGYDVRRTAASSVTSLLGSPSGDLFLLLLAILQVHHDLILPLRHVQANGIKQLDVIIRVDVGKRRARVLVSVWLDYPNLISTLVHKGLQLQLGRPISLSLTVQLDELRNSVSIDCLETSWRDLLSFDLDVVFSLVEQLESGHSRNFKGHQVDRGGHEELGA